VVSAIAVVGGIEIVSFGIRMSQWSSGEFVRMKLGVSGSPTCANDVYVRKSAKSLYKDSWCGEEVAYISSPRRTGVLGCSTISRVWSQCNVS
jgi:hypothetical protein